MPKGSLEVIAGCMSCGKSEELIRRIKREVIAKREVMVFKPAVDKRTDAAVIASRDGKSYTAIAISDIEEILSCWNDSIQVVAFDEGQFFSEDLIRIVNTLVDRGARVLVAGLDTDFRGVPFETIARLMALADKVTKLTAVCMRCGGVATRSQRLVQSGERVLVGGDKEYEARCRDCHEAL
ncbi:MAG: thymidine kinase [Patescibacteria group bacterium]|nr:thymidine kinase [Patescibacteria group bacterium]